MPGSVVQAHYYAPRYRSADTQVRGPDEDAFTLAVEAARQLLDRGSPSPDAVRRLDVVGVLPPEEDWAIREALGLASVSIHHHPPGPAAAFAALVSAAAAVGPEGSAMLLAVDLESSGTEADGHPPTGAASLACHLTPSPGLVPVGHGERGHPPWRPPIAREWVAAARRTVAAPSEGEPVDLLLIADRSPPVLLAEWAKAIPGTLTEVVPRAVPGLGRSPTVSVLHQALKIPKAPSDRPLVVAAIDPDRTAFLGLRRLRSAEWSESAGGAESRPLSVPGSSPSTPQGDGISQGAYIPRATYLEDLPSRWRLVYDRCPKCGSVSFPARAVCRGCGNGDGLVAETLPHTGLEVEASTTISPGAQPTEFDPQVESAGPYDVVIVRASPEIRLTAQVVDTRPGTLRAGDRVSLHLRRLYRSEGEWRYGLKAVRVGASPGN